MNKRPVLYFAIIITLIVELVLMFLVYNKIGTVRLPYQLGRLLFQLVLIGIVITNKSNKALFVLAGYHIVSGLLSLMKISTGLVDQMFGYYHIIIGMIIYFHDWLEDKINKKTDKQ